MKIFHVGICVYSEPVWISRALMNRVDYAECRPEDPQMIRKVSEFKPDVIFMQVQSPVIPLDKVRQLSEIALVINWMGDVRVKFESWFYQWSPYVINAFSNMRDVQELRGRGVRAEYMQIGIDPLIFKKKNLSKTKEVVFLANRYNQFPLSRYRQSVIYRLKNTFKDRFKLFGKGWPMADGDLNQNQHEECDLYNQAKIAVSVSHFDISRYFSDRLIRAMGSGTFTLSHHYQDIDVDFTPGVHLDTFHNEAQLIEKINYYLLHHEEREQIARQGYEHVHKKFTTYNMVDDIIDIYERARTDA